MYGKYFYRSTGGGPSEAICDSLCMKIFKISTVQLCVMMVSKSFAAFFKKNLNTTFIALMIT